MTRTDKGLLRAYYRSTYRLQFRTDGVYAARLGTQVFGWLMTNFQAAQGIQALKQQQELQKREAK